MDADLHESHVKRMCIMSEDIGRFKLYQEIMRAGILNLEAEAEFSRYMLNNPLGKREE